MPVKSGCGVCGKRFREVSNNTMDLSQNYPSDGEDEIFFGKLSLKEIKIGLQKRILFDDKQRQTIACVNPHGDETDESLRLIETQSEPDYVTIRDSLTEGSPQKPSHLNKQSISSTIPEDSFLKLEEMVSEYENMTTNNGKGDELDNTLEVVEYILKQGPHTQTDAKEDTGENRINNLDIKSITSATDGILLDEVKYQSPIRLVQPIKSESYGMLDEVKYESPINLAEVNNVIPTITTPHIPKAETKHFATPCKEANIKTPIFKTPANSMLPKTPSSSNHKKTPCKNLQYQHIASPVASYIKNCPQVPLVQEIRPKKPLPGPSSNIPKYVRSNSQTSLSNKENVNLPSLAYKSAKKTKVINMPSAGKLPECQWAKKIVSSLPRPVVIKHDHREHNLLKKVHPHQEDSFADLSLHQADVSVCTQKSAFCKPKN